ncbi:hypothetical protein EC991_004621 [Linnemannia zychae]|nr:hypothetical protein EC991_004621 [Linnemannia zychae]
MAKEPAQQLQQLQLQQQQQQQQQQLHPLDLPETLYLLASTLATDIRTLSKCSRVNKTWYNAFNPYLWRTLSCSRLLPLGHLSRQAIDRNVHLVHCIRVGRLDRARYGMLEGCRNLRRLHLEDERVSEWDLMGLSGTSLTNARSVAVGARKVKKAKSVAAGGRFDEGRRHSVPEMMGTLAATGASSSCSSSSSSSVTFLRSVSTTASTTGLQDSTMGLGYDGDDEDEDNEDDISGDRWLELLIALIKRNHSLQKICIMMERFEPTAMFWEAIEQAAMGANAIDECDQAGGGKGALKSLECVFTKITTPQLINYFLNALAYLETLVLQHCTFEAPSFLPGTLYNRQYPLLHSLTLATNTGIDPQTQLEFIQCFPNLRHLSWSIMGSFPLLVPEFCHLLQHNCQQITSLILSDRNLEPSDLTQILHAIPRLIRFFLRFDTLDSMFNDVGVMQAMRRHFGTLKDLEFGQVRSTIRGGTVLEFLRGCPELERLVAYGRLDCSRGGMMHFSQESRSGGGNGNGTGEPSSSVLADSNVSGTAAPMVEIITEGGEQDSGPSLSTDQQQYRSHQEQGDNDDNDVKDDENTPARDAPWVCLDLKTLHVIMTGDPQNIWQHQHGPSSTSLQHRLFHQLGRLTNLQNLSLGHCILWMYENGYSHHGLDFTLDAGLAQLSGLKKLEELNLEGIYQRMQEEDVKWMLDHWPRLRVVEGELHHKREERQKLDALMEQRGFKILNHSYRK